MPQVSQTESIWRELFGAACELCDEEVQNSELPDHLKRCSYLLCPHCEGRFPRESYENDRKLMCKRDAVEEAVDKQQAATSQPIARACEHDRSCQRPPVVKVAHGQLTESGISLQAVGNG